MTWYWKCFWDLVFLFCPSGQLELLQEDMRHLAERQAAELAALQREIGQAVQEGARHLEAGQALEKVRLVIYLSFVEI